MHKMRSISGLFFLLAILAAAFFVGCEKKETIVTNEVTSLDPNGVYFMAPDGSYQQVDLEELQNNQEVTSRNGNSNGNGNGNSHVNAHYTFFPPRFSFYATSTTIQINATENSQGVSGVGHMWRTWGAEGEFTYHVIMDADCLISDGADAIFVGRVKEVTGELSTLAPSIGSRIWIRVKDNGQGPNSSPDQYRNILINPGGSFQCDDPLFGLNGFFWNLIGPWGNVIHPDYVDVK